MRQNLLIFILFTIIVSSCNSPSGTKPNVLILYTDDHRYNTIHSLGNTEISTPNIDRLVEEGTSFTRAHIMGGRSGALCVPSRAMLNSGRYVNDLKGIGNIIPPEHITMPETFRDAGYKTFFTGKWHNDKASLARIFDDGANVYIGGMHWPTDGGHFNPLLHDFDTTGEYPISKRWRAEKFSSVMYANAAIKFIEEQNDSKSPFYVCVAFTSPHDPRTPPESYVKQYDPTKISLPVNYLPEHPFDNGDLKTRDEKLLGWPRTEDQVRNELALYYGMVSEVDDNIGRIIKSLEESGKLENTIIVFAGDNGLAVGSHGLVGKQNVYDHSMRIPMVISGPGIPKNERRKSFAYIPDIFPTLAELVGIEAPNTVTGKSLTGAIKNDSPVRENVYYLYRDVQRAIRTDDNWKIIKYLVKGTVTTQLFNLNEDPGETKNLASDTKYEGKLKEMEALLAAEMKAYKDDLDASKPYFGKKMPVRAAQKKYKGKRLTMNSSVTYLQPYSSIYPAKGENSLIDGNLGMVEDFNENWQAFEENDLDVIIDLKTINNIAEVELSVLSNQGAWIFLPEFVSFEISADNTNWERVNTINLEIKETSSEDLEIIKTDVNKKGRYVKITAKNIEKCPKWHPGAGGKAWLFVDEIIIK